MALAPSVRQLPREIAAMSAFGQRQAGFLAVPPKVLPLDWPEPGGLMPGGGLLQGGVVELVVHGLSGLSTRLTLSACRSAQRQAVEQGGRPAWCAFVDPSSTLYAPGVAATGVFLERLLVVRPPVEALAQTAVKLAESRAFAVIVIDTLGTLGAELTVNLGSWPRIVRRMSLALEGTLGSVVLITDGALQRVLPLPVAQRIELRQPARDRLSLRVVKDRHGRVGPARVVAVSAPFAEARLDAASAKAGYAAAEQPESRLRKPEHSLTPVQHAS